MSVFLTILAVLTAIVLALEARRRYRRASGRLGRPRGGTAPAPRGVGGPLNLERQSLRGGGRKTPGRGSRHLAGPMVVGLVFVFMGAWLVLSYFAPDAETAAGQPAAQTAAAPVPAPTTPVQGGRLTGQDSPAFAPAPSGSMAGAATAVALPAT
ncbi:MAG: hypothetical protein LBV79_06285, partial [Candidatus Adiutrix sp.]|nr:hypothetical protein [Candidatus Adiutrix sp.]